MICRNEYITQENGVGLETARREARLERIAAMWHDHCTDKYNKWAIEYNHRIDEMNAQDEADHAFAVKFHAWQEEVVAVGRELDALMKKFMAYEDVTPADWDTIAAGKERKVFALVAPSHPKDTWPRTVPYLNMIARCLHEEDEEERRFNYAKQYRAIVEQISRKGAEVMELKRIGGDTTDGVFWAKPVTTKQMQQWREALRAEKQQLQADWAKFDEDLNKTVLARLQGQCVLSRYWDAYAWAGMVLEDIGLVATDEAKNRTVQMIQEAVEQWHLDNGRDAESDDGLDADPEDVHYGGGIFFPYDRSHLDDGREPGYDKIGIDLSQDINYEDELFLPYDV